MNSVNVGTKVPKDDFQVRGNKGDVLVLVLMAEIHGWKVWELPSAKLKDRLKAVDKDADAFVYFKVVDYEGRSKVPRKDMWLSREQEDIKMYDADTDKDIIFEFLKTGIWT